MFNSIRHQWNLIAYLQHAHCLPSWLSDITFGHMSSRHRAGWCDIELKRWWGSRAQLARGRMLDKQRGHGCNSRSIRCVQIGGSNNSIAAANSLTAGAWVQKSWIMQWRPAGICCPTAISFNIGQASVGITHRLNKSCRQLALLFLCPAPSLWGVNFVLGRGEVNKWPKVSNSLT